MKKLIGSTMAALMCLSSACPAEDGWLLLNDSRQHVLFRAHGTEIKQVAVLGDRTIFGSSEDAVAIVSRSTADESGALWVFDKKTEQLQWKWSIAAHPSNQLSGPTNNVVIADGAAFFPAILQSADGNSVKTNELGGDFDLNIVELVNGSTKRVPLPKECSNPRLLSLNNIVLVYSWNGTDLWAYDKRSNKLRRIVEKQDLVKRGDVSAEVGGNVLVPSEYFILPSKGVFRVSKLGFVNRILDSRLSLDENEIDDGTELEAAGVIRVLPTSSSAGSAIAIVKRVDGETKLFVQDSLKKGDRQAEMNLPETVMPDSLLALNDGTFVYIDGGVGVVARTAMGYSRNLWNLRKLAPKADLFESRVISIDP